MAEDLPVELWLYILSFLPRSAVRKLIGVSRLLFEMALDDIYEEIRFIADDEEMHKTFRQLKYKGIARRVHHLYIRPAFFPSAEEGPNAIVDTTPPSDHKVSHFRKWFSHHTKSTIIAPLRPTAPLGILHEATEAIANCPSLRELTIVLHDHAIPPSFGPFLTTLWRTIGSNLRRLDLELTPAKIPFVFEVLKSSDPSVNLPNLEDLHLTLAITRFTGPSSATLGKAVVADLLPLMSLLRPTLRSLNLVSPSSLNLSPLFEKLEKFPLLQGFALAVPFSMATVSKQESFTGFLRLHKDTLKSFSIRPYTAYTGFNYSDASYEAWISPPSQTIDNIRASPDVSFCSLNFPELERLEISCKVRSYHYQNQGVALDLSKIGSSCLTEVILADLVIPVDQQLEMLKSLARVAAETLRVLVFGINFLRPEVVDFMADKFRKLRRLELEYMQVMERNAPMQPAFTGVADYSSARKINFTTEMSKKKYRHWNVKYLRCGVWRDSCKAYHPDMGVAMTVGQTFPEMPEIDSSSKCFCY